MCAPKAEGARRESCLAGGCRRVITQKTFKMVEAKMGRSDGSSAMWVASLILCAVAVGVYGASEAEWEQQPLSPIFAGPFVVAGNLSGEIWVFSLAGDSVGLGILVHTFHNSLASGLAIIDHSADGDLDIVAMVQPKDSGGTPTGETDIYLLENNGVAFEVSVIPDTIAQRGGFWFPMSDICAEDFLTDDYDDFIVSVTGDSRTVLYIFVYDPVSQAYQQSFLDDTPWATHAWLMDAGDAQEDSLPDFITFDYPSTADFADEIYLYSGDGSGAFVPSFACSTIHSVNDIAVGDFNNDGWSDFVVGLDDDGDPGAVWLYLGDGTGLFQLASYTPVFDLDSIHNSGQGQATWTPMTLIRMAISTCSPLFMGRTRCPTNPPYGWFWGEVMGPFNRRSKFAKV